MRKDVSELPVTSSVEKLLRLQGGASDEDLVLMVVAFATASEVHKRNKEEQKKKNESHAFPQSSSGRTPNRTLSRRSNMTNGSITRVSGGRNHRSRRSSSLNNKGHVGMITPSNSHGKKKKKKKKTTKKTETYFGELKKACKNNKSWRLKIEMGSKTPKEKFDEVCDEVGKVLSGYLPAERQLWEAASNFAGDYIAKLDQA